MQIIAISTCDHPDIAVNGGGAQGGNGIAEALIGVMLRDQMAAKTNGNARNQWQYTG
jgi:hypothetical protein